MQTEGISAITPAPIVVQYGIDCPIEKDSALSEAAILELQQSVDAFVSLAGTLAEYQSLYEDVVFGIHRMTAAIGTCEEVGMQPHEIREYLIPARLLHHRSSFVARAQDWPRGYAGDFETIEYLCHAINRVSAEDAIGYCIEDYALNTRITQQHRNKVKLQAEMMLRCCRSKKGARVLSIGCGGARDLRMIAGLLQDSDAEFVLCDSDAEALELARVKLSLLGERCTYVHGKVPRVMTRLKSLGTFDLVVAGGLFDYLPNRWIELMVGDIWRHLLNSEGVLFFTNIAVNNPYRLWMEYLADWSLRERTEGDIEGLCRNAGVDDGAVSVSRDRTNLALITTVVKPLNGVSFETIACPEVK